MYQAMHWIIISQAVHDLIVLLKGWEDDLSIKA